MHEARQRDARQGFEAGRDARANMTFRRLDAELTGCERWVVSHDERAFTEVMRREDAPEPHGVLWMREQLERARTASFCEKRQREVAERVVTHDQRVPDDTFRKKSR